MKKELRIKVWNKYNKHCAYCGKMLEYQQMQVDHINPIFRNDTDEQLNKYYLSRGEDKYDNYTPSCRSCNASKSCMTVDAFRKAITHKLMAIRRDSSQFRLLERFGVIEESKKDIIFYFEKHNSATDKNGS